MRGFPIVSLGALVGTYNACKVLIPQFEIDEYYGKNEIAIEKWKERYPNAVSYIRTFSVQPNNVSAISGTPTSWTLSHGFYYGTFYGDPSLWKNIRNSRLDSFFVKSVYDNFFNSNNYNLPETSVNDIYVNLPNCTYLADQFSICFSNIQKNIYVNCPIIQTIGKNFLCWDKNVENLFLNLNSSFTIGNIVFYNWKAGYTYINSTTNISLTNLISKFKAKLSSDCNKTLLNGDVITDIATTFDIYWSEEQNSTGSDR